MTLVEQWRRIHEALPASWNDARLVLRLGDEREAVRAVQLLTPAYPGRRASEVRFFCSARGAGPTPDVVSRLLSRLDRERLSGELELIESREVADVGPADAEHARATLADSWDAALTTLPPDWSDLYVEIELTSTDYLERGALLLSPVNPARFGERATFRFRCARRFGYGAAPEMVRRCLQRLDENGIRGDVRILRALSDTRPVSTQGPVWYVGGKSV